MSAERHPTTAELADTAKKYKMANISNYMTPSHPAYNHYITIPTTDVIRKFTDDVEEVSDYYGRNMWKSSRKITEFQ